MSGNHWTVVALDLNSKASFYGDPLGYPVPTNLLVELIQTLDNVSTALRERVDIHDLIPMHRPTFEKIENTHDQGIAKIFQYKHVLLFVGLLPLFCDSCSIFSRESVGTHLFTTAVLLCDKAKLKLYLQPGLSPGFQEGVALAPP